MATVSDKYLTLLDRHLMSGVPLENMHMTEPQRLRSSIVFEAYRLWTTNKIINPQDLVRRVARRMYSQMLSMAKIDPEIKKRCELLNIVPGSVRTHTEICNDVSALNHIIGHFDTPTANIEKAKVIEASDWLIREGMKMGDPRAIGKGADIKMAINNNFEEKKNEYENIASTSINITGDVSVIKVDRVNYTEEEKKRMAKKFGLPLAEAEKVLEESRGEYVDFEPVDETPEPDYIEAAQLEEEERRQQ